MYEYNYQIEVKHLFIIPSLLILLTRVYSAFSNGLLHVRSLTLGMSQLKVSQISNLKESHYETY